MMTRNTLKQIYFDWMCSIICDSRHFNWGSYRTLLKYLYNRDFYYIIDMDDNREADGMDLRYRFAYENNYNNAMVASYLDNKPCSILEVMTSLIIHCEEIMGFKDESWFYDMITSLGLISMTDDNFDGAYVDVVISKFLNRDYERDGKGGLFTVANRRQDLRDAEIWYQMNWYLKEKY